MRKLTGMPLQAVLLFEDETILRLFPSLRRGWSLKAVQARVSVSGRNARRALFGAINIKTGHRIVAAYRNMGQGYFQDFLRLLRSRYRAKPIWMLLDGASAHKALSSLTVARQLNIELLWLPKQCPELNAMEHLWRSLKQDVSSNHQYQTIEQHAQTAGKYILNMSAKQARTKAGILSKNFWLKTLF